MFEKKFTAFLIENDIDIDLLIKKDETELRRLEYIIAKCDMINIKTLMPHNELEVVIVDDIDAFLYFKSSFLRKVSCIKDDKEFMTYDNCENCKVSTSELCAFNGVYKTDGIIIKRTEI